MFKKVAVGISGGIDSAVATLLLKERGFDVTAVFMKNWDIVNEIGRCTTETDYADAEWICKKLNVPLVQVNFVKEYWNDVFSDLVKEYELGHTPNPDVQCNKNIKFHLFYNYARNKLKVDAIATGHYAATSFGPYLENYKPNTNVRLLTARDSDKDQTYFLSQVPQKPLRRAMFPLGNYLKKDVRAIAANARLDRVIDKKESMGICFIGNRHFQEFISEYMENKPGDFISLDTGEVVGKHQGFHHWTVGQGCRIAGKPEPLFVFRKVPQTNAILVVAGTNHPALYTDFVVTSDIHWINEEPIAFKNGSHLMSCQFRYQHRDPLIPCTVCKTSAKQQVIHLEKPQRAVTAGQFATFYLGNECLGSARILHSCPSYYVLGKQLNPDQYKYPL